MAAPCYIMWNGAVSALTSPWAGVACSAVSGTVMTMLQVKPVNKIRIIEWGYNFIAVPTAPLKMELVETGAVFATVTTGASVSVVAYNDQSGAATTVTMGTSATGFTASGEGTVTATRLLDYNLDTGLYFKKQFPLGREPEVGAAQSLRIRATPTTAAATTIACYIVWEE